ncbi:MAG: hypothetical protein ACSHXL_03730 [Bacteroidota bacterium]
MKRTTLIGTIVLITSVIVLSSCSKIIFGIYGMHKLKPLNEQTIVSYSEKYDIPSGDNYELDTSYFNYLFSLDSTKYSWQIKNHYQPLQALYYDTTGHLVSYQLNCYAGGFPNLNWDKHVETITFPPNQQAPLDSILPIEKQITFLSAFPQTNNIVIDGYDYIVVVVYWSRYMGRQSKRLIHYVQERSKIATEKKVKILYVNTDNVFAGGSE